MIDGTCVACDLWGSMDKPRSADWPRYALLKLSVMDFSSGSDPRYSDILIHPACMVEYLDSNPHLAITSRRDAMVEAKPAMNPGTEIRVSESTSHRSPPPLICKHGRQRAICGECFPMPTIDEELGYPGVESLGIPQEEESSLCYVTAQGYCISPFQCVHGPSMSVATFLRLAQEDGSIKTASEWYLYRSQRGKGDET